MREQITILNANEEQLLTDKAGLQEASSLREDTIRLLQGQLEEERNVVRLLQRDFESVKLEADANTLRPRANSEFADIQGRLQATEVDMQRITAENIGLKGLVATKESSIEALRENREGEVQKSLSLQRELEAFKIERDADVDRVRIQQINDSEDVRRRMIALETERDLLLADAKKFEALAEEREQLSSGLRQNLEHESQKAITLQKELDGLKIEYDTQLSRIRLELGAGTQEFSVVREQLVAMTEERDQMKAANVSFKAAQNQKDKTIEELSIVLEEKKANVRRLQTQLDLVRTSERQRAEEYLAEAAVRADELLMKTQVQLTDMQAARDQALSDIQHYKNANIEREDMNKSLRKQLDEVRSHKSDKDVSELSVRTEESFTKMVAQLAEIQSSRDQALSDLEHYRKIDMEREETNKSLRMELDAMRVRERQQAEKNVAGEADNFKNIQLQLTEALVERDQARSDIEHYKKADKEREQANKSLQRSLDEERKRASVLHRQMATLRSDSESADLQSQVQRERDIEILIRHVGSSSSQANRSTSDVQSLSGLRDVFDDQTRSIQSLQRELEAVKAERDAMLMAQSKRNSVDEIVSVRKQLQVAEAEREQLRSELQERARSGRRNSVDDMVDLRKQVARLEAELAHARNERAQFLEQRDQDKRRSLKEMDSRKGSPQINRQEFSVATESASGGTQREQAISSLRRSIQGEFRADAATVSSRSGWGSEARPHFDVDLVSADDECVVVTSRGEDASPDGRRAWSASSTWPTESTVEETPVPPRRSQGSPMSMSMSMSSRRPSDGPRTTPK